MVKINKKIFKAYDIRGLYPSEIDEYAVNHISKAFAKFLRAKRVVVGRDMRSSSKVLQKAFVEGLLDMGVDVYDIGLTSTPMLYFAPTFLKADGAAMITASHNPMSYGGVKFTNAKGYPIFTKNGLRKIELLSSRELVSAKKRGVLYKKDIEKDYIKNLKKNKFKFKKFTVVFDAMHGSMGPTIKKVFKSSGIDVKFISCNPDSNLPGYKTPNPRLKGNRVNIEKAIKKEKADLGIMFDGDGDRMAVIDSKGEKVTPNFFTTLVIEELMKNNKKIRVVGDVRASRVVSDIVKENGGKYFTAKAGNPYVKAEMIRRKAIFGFETTGHLFFKDSNYAEDTITATIHLLNYLSGTAKAPQEIFDEFKGKYFIAEEINFEIKDKNILRKVAKQYRGGKISRLDGITVEFSDFRFNIRTSNTEPLIRFNLEASSKKLLEEKKKEFIEFVLSLGGKVSES